MKKIFTLVSVLLAVCAYAQQLPIDNQYIINKYVLSPAYGGFNENIEAFAGDRQNWLGITGAPEKKFLNINGSLGESSGLGALFTYETVGSFSNFYANAAYAFRVKMGENASLSFGFGGEYYKNQLEISKLKTQGQDPLVMSGVVVEGATYNANFGMLIKYKGLNVSVGLPRILNNKLALGDSLFFTLAREYTAHISYFYEGKKFAVEPFVVVRKTTLSPLIYEGALMLKYDKRFWLAPMYRSNGSVGASVGVALGPRLVLNYTYETGSSASMSGMSSGTHEISFGFLMRRTKNKDANPTIFPPDEPAVIDSLPILNKIRDLKVKTMKDKTDLMKKIEDLEKKLANAPTVNPTNPTQNPESDWSAPAVMNDIKFATGSDQLFASSYPALNKLASALEKRKKMLVLITGHTDNVGSPAYNKILSLNRANAIKRYLVDKRKIEENRITTVGKGSEVPKSNADTDEARSLNRRIEIQFKEGK